MTHPSTGHSRNDRVAGGAKVCRCCSGDSRSADLKEIIDDLARRGIGAPVLLRFPQLVAAQVRKLQRAFSRLGFESRLMPTIGLHPADLPYQPRQEHKGPLRLLFVGNIITLNASGAGLQADGTFSTARRINTTVAGGVIDVTQGAGALNVFTLNTTALNSGNASATASSLV